MYKSPIELMTNKMQNIMVEQQEGHIIQVIQQCGVNVDKDELIKALLYDRNQYDEGYQDAVKTFAAILRSHYPHTNSVLKRIDAVEQELIGGDKK